MSELPRNYIINHVISKSMATKWIVLENIVPKTLLLSPCFWPFLLKCNKQRVDQWLMFVFSLQGQRQRSGQREPGRMSTVMPRLRWFKSNTADLRRFTRSFESCFPWFHLSGAFFLKHKGKWEASRQDADVNAFGNAHPEDNAEADLLALFPMTGDQWQEQEGHSSISTHYI